MSIVQDVLRDFERVENDRSSFEEQWEEIAERVMPAFAGYFHSSGAHRIQGEKRTEKQFDSTASIGLFRFSAVVDSLLTPANQIWHKITASNKNLRKDRNVKLYFDEVNDCLWRYRYSPRANFQSQNQNTYVQLGAFGTGSLFVDADKQNRSIRYRAIHLGDLFLEENHQGIIDKAYRRIFYDARQLMQKWPKIESETIKSAAERGDRTKFCVIHCVKPNEERDDGKDDYRGMAFASYYCLREQKELLETGGYRTWPYPTSRYFQAPQEIYGRSPAMSVLPAIKTLNEEKKTILKQGQRIVDPVLLAFDDGVVDSFSLRSGAINYGGVSADGRALIQPLPVGNIAVGKELMDDERLVIKDAFLETLFQVLTENPQMTATEVMERVKEKSILLAPTVGRQQNEKLGPLIEREIDVLSSLGLLPEPPQELIEAGAEYSIEYDSPLSRAARAGEAAGAMRSIESALAVVNVTQDPSLLDHFDWDVIVPDMADINGVPARYLRSFDAVERMREARNKQAQIQQAIEAAPAVAGIAKSAGVGARR